jgi:hypothetical protein
MTKQFVLTLALASLIALLLAQSPPPPPTPTKSSQEKQDVSNVEKSPTQNTASPSQTPTTPINKTAAEPNQEDKTGKPAKVGKKSSSKWNWGAVNTGIVTFFTLILTGVGIFQYLSMRKQAEYMGDGLIETKKAADAAKESAGAATKALENAERAAALTERAIVLIDSISWGPRDNPVLSGIELRTRVTFTLKNFGKTMANKVQMHGSLIPSVRPKNGLEVERLRPTTIAPQGSNSWTVPALQNLLTLDEAASINQSREELHFHIVATYEDSFDKYKYECTGRFDPVLKRFLISGSVTS